MLRCVGKVLGETEIASAAFIPGFIYFAYNREWGNNDKFQVRFPRDLLVSSFRLGFLGMRMSVVYFIFCRKVLFGFLYDGHFLTAVGVSCCMCGNDNDFAPSCATRFSR